MKIFPIRLFQHDLLENYELADSQLISQCCRVRDLARDCSESLYDFDSITNASFIDTLQQLLEYVQALAFYFADSVSGRACFNIQQFVCNNNRFKSWSSRLSDLTRHAACNQILVKTGFDFFILSQNCSALSILLSSYIGNYLRLHPDFPIQAFPYDWSNVPFDPVEPCLDIDFDPAHYLP